jgi:predicted HTH domain antitoxin
LSGATIEIPQDILGIIGKHKDIEKESRMLIAAELYREGEISAGKAAELANLPYEDFLDELEKRRIKIFSLLGVSEAKEEELMAEKYLE